jgi:hypothetical protein
MVVGMTGSKADKIATPEFELLNSSLRKLPINAS